MSDAHGLYCAMPNADDTLTCEGRWGHAGPHGADGERWDEAAAAQGYEARSWQPPDPEPPEQDWGTVWPMDGEAATGWLVYLPHGVLVEPDQPRRLTGADHWGTVFPWAQVHHIDLKAPRADG